MTTSSTNSSAALFEPCAVGAWRLPNRVVMAPLTRNRSPGGVPPARVATYYAQRASAGLLISEATAITQQGQGYADVPGLYTPAQLAGWRAVTDAVHAAGGRIVCQLWHVGRISHVALQPGGRDPVAPSAIPAKAKTVLLKDDGTAEFVPVSPPRALSRAEISGIVADYARAAKAAVAAGFDGVEIHGANGYLIDQFLKTGSNHRDDDYGGPIPQRARFALEVAQAVAAAIGGDRTGIRVSPVTPANDADTEDTQPLFEHLLRGLAPLGLAYVHVIEGSTGGPRELPDRPFDYAALRQTYRDAGGTGAWMVNNGYDRTLADGALAQGADLVAFGRPFISNPDLVRRLREGLPWAEPDRKTFYGGGDAGYIDYPGRAMIPLVLLPGLACDAELFRDQLQALQTIGPVQVADVHTREATLPAMAARLLAEHPGPLGLAGASMGGMLALQVWRLAPERVRGLALLGTTARADTPAQIRLRTEGIAAFEAGRMDEILTANLVFAFHASNAARLAADYGAMIRRAGVAQLVAQNRAVMAREDLRPDLADIACPLLVMGGDSDGLTPPECAREIAAVVPQAQLEILADCGHMLTWERPEPVTEALTAWWRSLA